MKLEKHATSAGHSRRLGTRIEKDGINFAIYCPYATKLELLLFKSVDDTEPEVIDLDRDQNRNMYYWHIKVHGIKDGQIYGWRVKEVRQGVKGVVFDPQKVLLDPYALRVIFPKNYNRTFNRYVGSNIPFCAKNVVIDTRKYDWGNEVKPKIHISNVVVYEMHVGGFTKDSSSGVPEKLRGTYKGIVEKIPYLKELGINAIELLPVFQFDEFDALPGKKNYWGYSPMSFFAVHGSYSSDQDVYGPINEFRDMVKAMHVAGIEVYLDVVYNHTSEGDEGGPLYSFKGLSNPSYYILDEKGKYKNYSGCGNTLNASHPVVKRMITDSLHFWTEIMHVDGFRFDLACVLSRSKDGEPLNDPPTTLAISTDYRLSDVKLIAEPWDAAGMYQVGSMAGKKWREWNGQFRDDMRMFMRGDNGMIQRFVNRLLGSPDIYNHFLSDSHKSVNFITCHDGFTLWDLVSYNQKHNFDNGENNRDGGNENFSCNYGVEGPTRDKAINAVRLRQAKNLMVLNLMSLGVPMILMGDEVLRTQEGNNNAYCQDNDLSYMKWNPNAMQKEMLRFTKSLVNLRINNTTSYFVSMNMQTLTDSLSSNRIQWHGVEPFNPDWSPVSHSIGVTFYSYSDECFYYAFINAYWEGLHVKIPEIPGQANEKWKRVIDTSLPSPDDVEPNVKKMIEIGHNYYVGPRSILVLVGK